MFITQFYEDRACLWDAVHEYPSKKTKRKKKWAIITEKQMETCTAQIE